jgi:murein DD-endopeptidase / murein LD-carboxypeptidase
MTVDSDIIVARARSCVGARFRPQGRDPRWGLDCVGLVAFALDLGSVRSDYALRGGSAAELEQALTEAGLWRTAGPAPGDVLLMQAGAGQLHLGIATAGGMIHADAGLRQVVERPGRRRRPLISAWRKAGRG